mmetsp:Transcript_103127/g.199807  ORF Transcript_103127/g.199807 Transcript_103127/m.199807 type:complete len:224 (-) Transcript_103127:4-675(-)
MAISGMSEFQELEKERDRLEAQIKGLGEYLTADGMPGISGPLVDENGFPRADLDIYAIRTARNKLACAQTDHMEVMKKIEQVLVTIHASSRIDVPRSAPSAASMLLDNNDLNVGAPGVQSAEVRLPPKPFAWIDEVTAGSPAQAAGLTVGDQVCCFGDVSRDSTGDLNACFAAVGQLVPRSIGSPIQVLVLRGQPPAQVLLQLIPNQWAGRGLLGCHLAPKTD